MLHITLTQLLYMMICMAFGEIKSNTDLLAVYPLLANMFIYLILIHKKSNLSEALEIPLHTSRWQQPVFATENDWSMVLFLFVFTAEWLVYSFFGSHVDLKIFLEYLVEMKMENRREDHSVCARLTLLSFLFLFSHPIRLTLSSAGDSADSNCQDSVSYKTSRDKHSQVTFSPLLAWCIVTLASHYSFTVIWNGHII